MFRNKSADVHQFSMVPKADVPRSTFRIQKTHKTTFDASLLIPVYVDEVLPGDTFNLRMTAFARLATPIFPIMDNLYLDAFFFFVPNRLLWDNWVRFMGEQVFPGDPIDYTIPEITSPVGGHAVGSIYDHMGLPVDGQIGNAATMTHSALPLRAYNRIYREWFRDENLMNPSALNLGDGPDDPANYTLLKRGKRHDYFTSCLPWTQKGTAVGIPIETGATITTDNTTPLFYGVTDGPTLEGQFIGDVPPFPLQHNIPLTGPQGLRFGSNTGLQVDLTTATATTINQLRNAFQIQKLLERDARGGTRYTEIIRSHFGVVSPDARLQRSEYLGGGSTMIAINPVTQNSATNVTGSDTPIATVSAMGTVVSRNSGFTQSFTEHGVVIGLVMVRADLTYQQGMRKMWSRSTRYDFYFPAFAMLGEQAVLNKEIFMDGSANDDLVFGYQERWSEYRHNPSEITGLFRSTAPLTIDAWHLSQHFVGLPTLNEEFISENVPLERILAVGPDAGGQQLLFDAFFDVTAARPLPMYSVPGLIDHF